MINVFFFVKLMFKKFLFNIKIKNKDNIIKLTKKIFLNF